MEEQLAYAREDVAQGDIHRIRFIFTGLIPSNDTITSVSLAVTPTALTEAETVRSTVGQVVSVFIDSTAGVVGTEYLIKCTVGTSSGVAGSKYHVLRVIPGAPSTAVGASMAIPGTIYSATLMQAGTAAPVATVKVNTLASAPVWSRISEGIYRMILAGAFTEKTDLKAPLAIEQDLPPFQTSVKRIDADTIELRVMDAGGNLRDDWGPVQFEAKIYT